MTGSSPPADHPVVVAMDAMGQDVLSALHRHRTGLCKAVVDSLGRATGSTEAYAYMLAAVLTQIYVNELLWITQGVAPDAVVTMASEQLQRAFECSARGAPDQVRASGKATVQ